MCGAGFHDVEGLSTVTYVPHPEGAGLLDLVRDRVERGQSPAQIIDQLLRLYGEDMPESDDLDPDLIRRIHRGLLLQKRRGGDYPLGLS